MIQGDNFKMHKEKLREYFNELKKTFADTKISDGDYLEIAKDFVIHENISAERTGNQGVKPATEKQIAFLIQLGYDGKTNEITMQEASKFIEEYKMKNANQGY